jgi:DNA-binding beta-propeller fold protein YncE
MSGISWHENVKKELALGTLSPALAGTYALAGTLSPAIGSNTQVELPFTDLNHPGGMAVDTAGNVYVTDTDKNRVLKLPTGSNTQVELPLTSLNFPWGVAVDTGGNVYVTDSRNNRVVKLPAG